MDWVSSLIVLLVVGISFLIGKAYLDGFRRGHDKGWEEACKATTTPKETPPDDGETVDRTSQEYTDAPKNFRTRDGDNTP